MPTSTIRHDDDPMAPPPPQATVMSSLRVDTDTVRLHEYVITGQVAIIFGGHPDDLAISADLDDLIEMIGSVQRQLLDYRRANR